MMLSRKLLNIKKKLKVAALASLLKAIVP